MRTGQFRESLNEPPRHEDTKTETPSARTVFDGLTPGVTYTATVNTVGTAGPSDWSSPVSQMVI